MNPVANIAKARDALFGRTYELSLVKGYVARWGMAQAVRELIQNALDSESPFVYEFAQDQDGTFALRLNSEFATLTPQTLLLGATSKADSQDAIGSFGEGYKIALLVLTREGYDVTVENGDLLWKPRFRMSRTFGEEVLVIDESVAADRTNKGITFTVRGLSESQVEEIRLSCLRMQHHVGAVKRTRFGDVLLDQPGRLYVGSLFVCETELKFGYDIKPQYLRLERDRQTVSGWDLKDVAVKCWYDTGETERVANMIAEQVPDVEYATYNAPEIVREECYRIFRERHPHALIASSAEEARQSIEDGLVEYVYVGETMHGVVSRAPSYIAEERAARAERITPHVALAAFLSAHRDEMRRPAIVAFKSLILEAQKKWTLR